MTNITKFPENNKKATDVLIGPFDTWRVQVDGYQIPKLSGFKNGNKTCLVVDSRFCTEPLDDNVVHSVAAVIANALAIGAGYSHFGAQNKEQPFASKIMQTSTEEENNE